MPKFKEAAEARECPTVSDSLQEDPESPLHKTGKVKPELKWKVQNDAWVMGHMPRKTSAVE